MPFINYAHREIVCKLVYYGPGLGGKTTNLQYIYEKSNPDAKGKMISLATEAERTLYFDLLPLSLGEIRGFKVRFQLYTVPGQIFYDASRRLIVKGADGVVFVADGASRRRAYESSALPQRAGLRGRGAQGRGRFRDPQEPRQAVVDAPATGCTGQLAVAPGGPAFLNLTPPQVASTIPRLSFRRAHSV